MSNVYKKLQSARVALQGIKLKESGKNTFANYTYMELGDFLPHINQICEDKGLCGVVSFGKEEATLTIVNTDKPEESIVFTSPMSTAELKGCHPVQQLGAVHSYLRRYLWLAAFEIVEHDALDHTTGKPSGDNKPSPQAQKPAQNTAQPSDKHAEYNERIKTALKAIFGDDRTAALDEVERMTTFTGKDGSTVAGKRDYTKLSEKAASILCHGLEKRLADIQGKSVDGDDIPF